MRDPWHSGRPSGDTSRSGNPTSAGPAAIPGTPSTGSCTSSPPGVPGERCAGEVRAEIDGAPLPPRTLRAWGGPGDLSRPAPVGLRVPEGGGYPVRRGRTPVSRTVGVKTPPPPPRRDHPGAPGAPPPSRRRSARPGSRGLRRRQAGSGAGGRPRAPQRRRPGRR